MKHSSDNAVLFFVLFFIFSAEKKYSFIISLVKYVMGTR